ncbi:response regulator [Hymenobacter sp. CRA2]|uniref:response regulator n=1 Tax=Hymenobacter sp. CRA2 TaxID=1955620 RepID=UPI0009900516|nr:response regulator [Hymenobacter sp. CRA2]OON68252.1 DNA-binding response regulator [Hymenobacter sp. CRA2]
MSDSRVHILLVEDEAVLALDLSDLLEAEGYTVVGPARNGRRALELFEQYPIDLLLCDINIQGDWDGIETAARLQALRPLPIIYLTAHGDRETLDRALQTSPAAYLTKPVTLPGLRAAIEVALRPFTAPATPAAAPTDREPLSRESILQLNGHVFIKHNYQFVRVPLADILVLEADNTYTTLVTASRKYALRLPLSTVLERLAVPQLVRVHRSHAVNIHQVESFSETEAVVAEHTVPLGRQYKESFLQHFLVR